MASKQVKFELVGGVLTVVDARPSLPEPTVEHVFTPKPKNKAPKKQSAPDIKPKQPSRLEREVSFTEASGWLVATLVSSGFIAYIIINKFFGG